MRELKHKDVKALPVSDETGTLTPSAMTAKGGKDTLGRRREGGLHGASGRKRHSTNTLSAPSAADSGCNAGASPPAQPRRRGKDTHGEDLPLQRLRADRPPGALQQLPEPLHTHEAGTRSAGRASPAPAQERRKSSRSSRESSSQRDGHFQRLPASRKKGQRMAGSGEDLPLVSPSALARTFALLTPRPG